MQINNPVSNIAKMFISREQSPWTLRPKVSVASLQCEREKDIARLWADTPSTLSISANRTSYGDCCIPVEGGVSLETTKWAQILDADWEAGVVEVRPGVTLRDLAEVCLPKGWFFGASPGTMKSTIGGCVACDVHGKNHHGGGSFGNWVDEIELVGAGGEAKKCSPTQLPELFWASVGGLGHTGIISRVRLRLQKVRTGWIRSTTVATRSFDETAAAIEADSASTYSVSWIDSLACGRNMGRGVVMLGEHADAGEVDALKLPRYLERPRREISIPFTPPNWASPPVLWRTFNEAYHTLARAKAGTSMVPVFSYFCPLDGVRNWNVVYGRRGFLEYQFAVPLKGGLEVCRKVCERLASTDNGSFLAVIKKFGPPNFGPLSFPIEGYTLAVDMPYRGVEQEKLLRQLDELVAESGGRIYLVKDTRLPSDWIPIMYPRLGEWREIVNRNDPSFRFSNHQTARLDLRGMKR